MQIERNGWVINFEALSPRSGPPLVLIAGMGEQIGSVEFPDDQAQLFADNGYYVIRVDNRDCGLSLPHVELPRRDFMQTVAAAQSGEQAEIDYTLWDNADDIAAVLDELEIKRAHFCGASLGGLIIRWFAVRHPQRVLSLTIIMSGSGAGFGDDGPQVGPGAIAAMSGRTGQPDRSQAIEAYVEKWRSYWGSAFPFPEDWLRERASVAHDRSYRPDAYVRQMIAAFAAPGLWHAQRAIDCPILVIHGDEDSVFSMDHPRALHALWPQSRLVELRGVGHAMPKETWDESMSEMMKLHS
ncbi:alpha/beta hydrolase [Altererythrobacter sp. SALINAS58]|uniref:alpha/beta fold hydrolase n=1 Tax=Alteripontixanthobacter muriae TaxID=2705546 RepID=UPI001576243A|nr:alpha/beta hydrolase [Alteripontixanthobacter muriae]NTZ44082.1 alpha/beta hydrolase [Alteripontixanthobacter muriae]